MYATCRSKGLHALTTPVISRNGLLVALVAVITAISGCSDSGSRRAEDPPRDAIPAAAPDPAPTPGPGRGELPKGVSPPPPWLGKRVLPVDDDGLGIATSTPRLLRDRRLATVDRLPPPRGERFVPTIRPLPPEVVKRSTWRPSCPVSRADLSYVTVSFWGFDERPHTGELIVHRSVAREVVSVFRALYRDRWPIEEMRVTTRAELDAPPTGDGNNTSAFVCRPARFARQWSEHAYGRAVDVNPFHNPYVRGELVLPERALSYRDRAWERPGMIEAGDVVTTAFGRIGWGWGGNWTSAKDWMHFSGSGG